MRDPRPSIASHSLTRTLAALVGTLAPSVLLGLVLASALPLSRPWRYLVGLHLVFPTWITAMTLVFLASSGRRAWLLLVAATAALGLAAALLRR